MKKTIELGSHDLVLIRVGLRHLIPIDSEEAEELQTLIEKLEVIRTAQLIGETYDNLELDS